MQRNIISPSTLIAPNGHYSHGVVVSTTRTLYVSGQLPLDSDGNLVGPGDARAQSRQTLENLRQVVEAAGGRIEDIAKTTVFLVDREDRKAVGEVRREFFVSEPPANSLLIVKGLALPEFLVEIEAIVPLPEPIEAKPS